MGAIFDRGDLALEFIGTLHERASTHVEELRTPADLAGWLLRAGVVHATPAATETDLHRATTLREAIYRSVGRLIAEVPPDADDIRLLNTAAAISPPTVQVSTAGTVTRAGGVAAALSVVARDALCLWELDGTAPLKWCDDGSCTRAFVDRSRGRRRRWCGMANCGDRAKARAYRHRLRQRPAAGTSTVTETSAGT